MRYGGAIDSQPLAWREAAVKAVAINVLAVPRERRSNPPSPDASELVWQTNLLAG